MLPRQLPQIQTQDHSTSDLLKRVYLHKQQLVPGFTQKYNADRLIYFEALSDMNAARKREKQLKGFARAKKIALVNALNPTWRDLSEDFDRES